MPSWSDLEIPWNNVFEVQNWNTGNQSISEGANAKKSCTRSEIHRPNPQKLPFYNDASLFSGDEFEQHHLEQALVEMANKGDLEDFLKATTISLKEIQDDFGISYGNPIDDAEFIPKPRARRNSIGTADELIKCPFPGCNKIFNRSYNFKSHLKSHSNEKPFKCDHCSLSFARCHDLKRLIRIHDSARQESHKCDICGKAFSRSDALNRHIRLNTCIS